MIVWAKRFVLLLASLAIVAVGFSESARADHLHFKSSPLSGTSGTQVVLTSVDRCPEKDPPSNSVQIFSTSDTTGKKWMSRGSVRSGGSWETNITFGDYGPGKYGIEVECYLIHSLVGVGGYRYDHSYVPRQFVVETAPIPMPSPTRSAGQGTTDASETSETGATKSGPVSASQEPSQHEADREPSEDGAATSVSVTASEEARVKSQSLPSDKGRWILVGTVATGTLLASLLVYLLWRRQVTLI